MRRWIVSLAAVAAVVVSATALAGCGAQPPAGSDNGPVQGLVASAEHALLVVDSQRSSLVSVHLGKVVAPEAVWVIVHESENGELGRVVGRIRVQRGTTTDVEVPLVPGATGNAQVTMHVDRGRANDFEFDERDPVQSPDRPIVVDGRALALPVVLSSYGARADSGAAKLAVYRQSSIGSTLTVGEVLAPAPSWLVVQQGQQGRPGKVLGFAPVPAGLSADCAVLLSAGAPREDFFVTLFEDAGVAGRLEFDPRSPLSSADQPYFVDDAPVTARVLVDEE